MAIYIPGKIRVGYQKREDTFTKKLAYVIYYDNFGKLRKERSWEQWRDDKIEPEEFENIPTSGFMLNKGHTRYNWSHFGNSKTVRIRIYDPRGIEFEITAENLVAVLMHTDCSRREITGELVYAWNGTELMLLPCCSEEYTKAKKFTELQAKKFSAKDLKEGATYLTKSEKEVIYLGRFDYYDWKCSNREGVRYEQIKKKEHLFAASEDWPGYGSSEEIKKWFYKPLSPSANLATLVTEEIPENFATLVEKWQKKSKHASAVKKFTIEPEERGWSACRYQIDGDKVYRWSECGRNSWGWNCGSGRHGNRIGYEVGSTFTLTQVLSGDYHFESTLPAGCVTGRLYAQFENGAKDDRFW